MQKAILGVALLALVGSFIYLNSETIVDSKHRFEAFKLKHNKRYQHNEEAYRLQVYLTNVEYVQAYNRIKGKPVFGETQFMDLTDEEFKAIYLTKRPHQVNKRVEMLNNYQIDSIDWRSKGAVTEIKDQGQCGSCWAFSAVGVLEGYFAVNTGDLVNFSEQQLVDCSGIIDFNFGCDGGDPSRALNYVKRNGITTGDAYPYTAIKGNCVTKGGPYKIKGFTSIAQNEQSLVAALAESPVSISVDATNWKYYDPSTADIFSDCESEILNHSILAVGFTKDYYIVKNSWTTGWGLDGYIQVARGGDTCGILQEGVIVAK